ncbi:MAG TPA: AMP-binding protein, partial [Candidatus Heimdallarchaeota archaeon]|nr:AMP-binding protein [Candidatus Heimdallarchaeota archaeon]
MRYSPEDYEDEVRRFEWNIPEDYNIVDVVAGHAEDNPDKVAIFWEDAAGNTRRVTFGELIDGARRFGSALVRLGVNKGDPILHLLPRIPEAPMVQLGTFIAGAVAVPCTEMLKAKEIGYRVKRSGAKAVIADVST